jgi:hypothetical protein
MPKESFLTKALFVAAFLASGAIVFVLSIPLVAWIDTKADVWNMFAVQAILAIPPALVIFAFEERVIWKMLREDWISTIYPVTFGAYIGYVIHFM